MRRIVEGPSQKMESPYQEHRIYSLLAKLNACCPNHPGVADAVATIDGRIRNSEHPRHRLSLKVERTSAANHRGDPTF